MPFGRPTSGRKCYITPAFSGVPKERGTKSELVGPTSGRKCYITPAFSGVPNKGDKIKVGPQVGGNATSPLHSRGSPKKWGQNQIWRGPQVGGIATSPLHSRGSPKRGGTKSELVGPTSGRKCYITPAFLGIPNKGDKIKVGPQVGGNATSPLHSRGSPMKGGQNQNWMPNPCLLGGPQVGGNATSPLHSRGSPKKGGQNQNWWGPQVGGNATSPLHSRGSPTKGTKSKWAHKWAEMLHHPCILGDPQ